MLKLNKNRAGFTIIELLIVIVVIGILAVIVISQFGNVTQRARDSERQTDITALQSQLEFYYQDATEYPSTAEFNTTTLENIEEGAFIAPNADNGEVYTYAPVQADGTACTLAAQICTSFTLSAQMETDQNDDGVVDATDVFQKDSLN